MPAIRAVASTLPLAILSPRTSFNVAGAMRISPRAHSRPPLHRFSDTSTIRASPLALMCVSLLNSTSLSSNPQSPSPFHLAPPHSAAHVSECNPARSPINQSSPKSARHNRPRTNPMVGTGSAAVNSADTAGSTNSSTIANAPASTNAFASHATLQPRRTADLYLVTAFAFHLLRQHPKCPRKEFAPHARTCSSITKPPSAFTASAPASTNRRALATARSGVS